MKTIQADPKTASLQGISEIERKLSDVIVTRVEVLGIPTLITSIVNDKDLFPPAAQVCIMNDEETEFTVSTFVYIDSQVDIDPEKIYVSEKVGSMIPEFYISYDAYENATESYYMYQVEFKCPFSNNPATSNLEIVTFLRNLDPITSRGTVTTVKKPMGHPS
ncbi:hypothetical protein IMCC3317_12770 [Kordia antarctica]|uniref:Uncharacterized protein n=1 Tax=Kordia antarctica TaxID=1218801 RepID=A0A7L4ZHM0_9FLAO|nr:hypothetical protein [Kordia antarctica]QHI35929.1 hypothetical protein IMCC3317_12770 [Kordia antarctica]